MGIDRRRTDDARNGSQRETCVDHTENDGSQAYRTREWQSEAGGDLENHEEAAEDEASGETPEMADRLPGFRIAPEKRDDAEEDGAGAKEEPAIERGVHRAADSYLRQGFETKSRGKARILENGIGRPEEEARGNLMEL